MTKEEVEGARGRVLRGRQRLENFCLLVFSLEVEKRGKWPQLIGAKL